VSGGFAIVQPNSELSINAVEGFPLEDFSIDAVRSQILEAQKIASGSGSEQDIAEAKVELEVRWLLTGSERRTDKIIGLRELTGSSQVKRGFVSVNDERIIDATMYIIVLQTYLLKIRVSEFNIESAAGLVALPLAAARS